MNTEHRIQQLTAALTDNPASAGPMAVRLGLLIGGPVADLLAACLVARLAELDEQDLAALHLHVARERERRLHAPDVFPPATPKREIKP